LKKILLTGSRGFFGSRFIRSLGRDYEIIATTSDSLKITIRSDVENIISAVKPDYVVHAAAIAETDFCNKNPERCRAVNVEGTMHFADAVKKTGSRLVFLSTEQVFNGNAEAGPYTESDTPVPDTEYGKNKLEAESYIISECRDYLILRCTWMFGVPSKGLPVSPNLLWNTMQMILKGEPFKVPANEYRGITYIDDMLDRFNTILGLPEGVYHTGSVNNMSRYETVCHIFDALGIGSRIPELVIRDDEKYSGSPRDVRLDTSAARGLGIVFPDTAESLSRCISENYLRV